MTNAKRLAKWLASKSIPQREAARVFGVSAPAFHAWVHGRKLPTYWHRVMLERWTGGAIAAAGWATAEELELERRAALLRPYEAAP